MDDLIKKLPIAFPRFGRRKEGTNRGETRDSKDRKDAEEFARGIMLTPTANTHVDKNDRTLELALDQPLGNALESIFSHQGNVLITFPSASDFKVSQLASYINVAIIQ